VSRAALISQIQRRTQDPIWLAERPKHQLARLFKPAKEVEIAAAERALGFGFPPLLRKLYLEIGNGGFGPGYGLQSVRSADTDQLRVEAVTRAMESINHGRETNLESYWVRLAQNAEPPEQQRIIRQYIEKNGDRFDQPENVQLATLEEAEEQVRQSVMTFDIVEHHFAYRTSPHWSPHRLAFVDLGCATYDFIDCSCAEPSVYWADPTWGTESDAAFDSISVKIADSLEEYFEAWLIGKDIRSKPLREKFDWGWENEASSSGL
jgi:hypothetical protein